MRVRRRIMRRRARIGCPFISEQRATGGRVRKERRAAPAGNSKAVAPREARKASAIAVASPNVGKTNAGTVRDRASSIMEDRAVENDLP